MINGKMTPGSNDKDNFGSDHEFSRLAAELPPRPVRTLEQARIVEKRIAELVSLPSLSEAQTDYLDLLSDQLEEWEEANEEIPDVGGVELIRFLIDEQGLRQKDLVPIFGTESITSEVLSGRRELQRKHIEALAGFFKVSPSAFFPRRDSDAKPPHSVFGRTESQPPMEAPHDRSLEERKARRLTVLFDAWAPAVVDHARILMQMDITVVDPQLPAAEKVRRAKREHAILCTFRSATASLLRLTEIGQVVMLASKNFGAATQTKLFERVSFFLMGQNQSAAGLPSHERIVLAKDRIDLERFNSGSRIHTETIPITLETA